MHITIATIFVLVAMTRFVGTSPAPTVPKSMPLRLHNGVGITTATTFFDEVEFGPNNAGLTAEEHQELPEARRTNCKGSFYCLEGVFHGDCMAAYAKINATKMYRTSSGDHETGVCHVNCGIFLEPIEDKYFGTCDYPGEVLQHGFNTTIKDGCKKCGSYRHNWNCEVKVNYVASCDYPGRRPFIDRLGPPVPDDYYDY